MNIIYIVAGVILILALGIVTFLIVAYKSNSLSAFIVDRLIIKSIKNKNNYTYILTEYYGSDKTSCDIRKFDEKYNDLIVAMVAARNYGMNVDTVYPYHVIFVSQINESGKIVNEECDEYIISE